MCACLPGDPCMYHQTTCITCHPKCQGHPPHPMSSVSQKVAEERTQKVNKAQMKKIHDVLKDQRYGRGPDLLWSLDDHGQLHISLPPKDGDQVQVLCLRDDGTWFSELK